MLLKTSTSYWQVFRLIFVLFSLYLMGDAFYRWDGFRYYASFSEFVPGVALMTILWSMVSALVALVMWLPLRLTGWFCLRIGWKVSIEHLWVFAGVFLFLGTVVWIGKRLVWADIQTTLLIKLIVILSVIFAGIFLSWKFFNKLVRLMDLIQKRITPLVWLFGIWVMISFPLVAYHTWGKQADNVVSEKPHQSSVAGKNRPNIILVTFDALTARDMSTYGYHRPTTPFISEWAKTASLFTRLQAESNFTTPATASLMTGKRVWTHQTYHLGGSKPVKGDIENLPLVLRNNGYHTMAFVVNPYTSVKSLGILNSFDFAPIVTEFSDTISFFGGRFGVINKVLYQLFDNKIRLYDWIIREDFVLLRFLSVMLRDFTTTTVPPEKAFNKFLSAIDNNPPEPYFAWIHLYPPHDPYLPPEPFMGMFDSSHEQRTFKLQDKGFRRITHLFKSQYSSHEIQSVLNALRARYNEHIRYCDNQFENFVSQLTNKNKLINTLLVLSSDHGESFEHNYLGHSGPHLYEQLIHIPLIIKETNQTEEHIINDIVEQIDIPPTILDLVDIPVPSWMEGRSLVPLLRDKSLPSRPAFSMNFEKNPSRGHQITGGTIAVREGDYKLIYYLKETKSLLFNLEQDPDELNNLFDEEPEVGERLLFLIQDNLKKANEKIKSGK